MNRFLVHRILIVLLLLGTPAPDTAGQAPSCVCFIRGVVVDQHNRQPVPGVTVFLRGQNKGAVTDARGAYLIDGLCPGQYVLEGRIIGYNHFQVPVNLREGHEENFSLHEEEVHLKEIEVAAQRVQAPATQPLATLTGRELYQTRGLSLGESLKSIPGVSTLQTGSTISKPVIHGLHSNRVLILNNGIRQEGQQWGSEHAPEIDPFIANRISVVKGAAGVRYGSDAIGGVILVEPATLPYQRGLTGEVNLAGFSNGRQGVASALVQSGVKGRHEIAWRAQGTLKNGGNTRAPSYFLDNTGVREQNFSLAAGYHRKAFGTDIFYSNFHTQTGIFSGSHIGSVTDLLELIRRGEPAVRPGFTRQIGRPYQDTQHELLKAEFHYNLPAGGRLQWLTARQYNYRAEYDLHVPKNDSLAALHRPELTFRLTTYTNDLLWEHRPLAGKLSGQAGASFLYQYNLMSGRPLIPNFDQFTAGLFWIERFLSGGWELEAGARYDLRSLNSYRLINRNEVRDHFRFSNASGTLGVNRSLGTYFSLSYNAGTTWRAPNVSELFSNGVHHGAAAFEEGDAGLKPENALNNILSARFSGGSFTAELGGYLNYIRNYIYLQPQPEPVLTVRGAFPYFKYRQTHASFTGMDAMATWQIHPYVSLQSKLTYLRVYDRKNNDYLVMIPPNRLDSELKLEIPKVLTAKTVSVSVGHLLVSRQSRAPAHSDLLPPPGGYTLWNAQLGGTFPLSDRQELKISLTGYNLLNRSYRDYMNRLRYFADETGRNIGLRIQWVFGEK